MLQTVKSLFRKKGLYTYLQYTQLLAKKSDLQPFSKSLFFCWWWFFQIRMSRSIKMRRKKRQLVSEDFLLETATGNRENGILEKSLLGTTSCSSCAVPRTVSAPTAALCTRLFTDPTEFDASNTWYEERRKRRLLRRLRAVSRERGIGKGGYRPRLATSLSNPQQFRGPSSEPLSCCRL